MRGMKGVLSIFACLIAAAIAYANEADGEREIPISSIVTTGMQPGLLHTGPARHSGVDENRYVTVNGTYLQDIYTKTCGVGASNVFLVDAVNINGAVSATASVFLGARSAVEPAPVNEPHPPRGTYWLVAYVGVSGSEPNHWLVDKVTVKSDKIRFVFHRAKPGSETMDLYQYFFWTPLGTLAPGTYELELFDNDANAVSLCRRVIVGK
jgi:hypothetical protein